MNTSATQTFTITVTPVNAAPSFTKGPDQTVLEDSGPQTVTPWATAISPGPGEAGQTVTFNVTANTNAALFSTAPAVSSTGTLTYTPAANASGTATITLVLQDNGGTAGGGVDTSAPQTFTITVTAVNDAPTFTAGAGPSSLEDAGPQTVTPWATAISAGPGEAGQVLTFVVTNNTNPALFSAAPAVSAAGTLTYTSAPNAFGAATITLVLQDNGGGSSTRPRRRCSRSPSRRSTMRRASRIRPSPTPPRQYATPRRWRDAAGPGLDCGRGQHPGQVATCRHRRTVGATVVPFTGATPNGTVVRNADGSFTYVPNAGFTGVDSFSFQVTDGTTPVNGTINVTVSNIVDYVSNEIGANNAAGGDGRSTDAFDTLAAAVTAAAANDTIFVFSGISATTPLTGGIALQNGQKLLRRGRRALDQSGAERQPGAGRARRARRLSGYRRVDRERRQRARQHRERRPDQRRDPRAHAGDHGRELERHRRDVGRTRRTSP